MKSITLPDTLLGIQANAFSNCANLERIYIGSGLKTLEVNGIFACDKLTDITVDKDNEYYMSIDGVLYSKDGETLVLYPHGKTYTKFAIPEGVKVISDYAFYRCEQLREVVFPEGLISIGRMPFGYCYGISIVNLPDSVESLGYMSFAYCYNLVSIRLGENMKTIGDYAFESCSKLVEVANNSNLSLSLGSIWTHGGVASAAKEIHIGESRMEIIDGYIFFTVGGINYLMGYTGDETALILPESYKGESYEIHGNALYTNNKIASVVISDGVSAIGGEAFSWCESLEYVVISKSVKKINGYAFSAPNKLTDIYYTGSEADWAEIEIVANGNENLGSVNIHYGYVIE